MCPPISLAGRIINKVDIISYSNTNFRRSLFFIFFVLPITIVRLTDQILEVSKRGMLCGCACLCVRILSGQPLGIQGAGMLVIVTVKTQ